VPRAYLHYSIERLLSFFEESKTGTTVIHLGKADIDTFRVLLPPDPLLAAFAAVADPIDRRVVMAAQESRTLAVVRDALLPKLISGELPAPQAELEAAPV
jgi:type I restriction enzyme S subunit